MREHGAAHDSFSGVHGGERRLLADLAVVGPGVDGVDDHIGHVVGLQVGLQDPGVSVHSNLE